MNEQDIILVNAYLEGSLSNDEESIFNKRMLEDEVFKKHVEFEIQMRASLSDSEWSYIEHVDTKEILEYKKIIADPQTQSLKKNLKKIVESKEEKPTNTSKLWYGLAAILIVSISLFTIFNNDTPDDLYAAYLDTNEVPSLVVRSENTDELNTIQQLFDNKKYEEILPLITDSLLEKSNSSGILLIMKGISQIETNSHQEALKTFDTLINSDRLDAPKGDWYKALAYLKVDDLENCKRILSQIIAGNSYKWDEAKQLLEQLK